jgi:hypothetical protein
VSGVKVAVKGWGAEGEGENSQMGVEQVDPIAASSTRLPSLSGSLATSCSSNLHLPPLGLVTTSSTEVVYEDWGLKCSRYLRG